MTLTPQEHALVLQTVQSPGWALVKKQAESKIRLAWEALTLNDDEKQVMYLFHRSVAAKAVLYDFLAEVEEPVQTVPSSGEFHTREAEF